MAWPTQDPTHPTVSKGSLFCRNNAVGMSRERLTRYTDILKMRQDTSHLTFTS